MPTPKEWQENLERIRSFADGSVNRVPEQSEQGNLPDIKTALIEVMAGADHLAEDLLKMLNDNKAEDHKEILSGFLSGVIISVIAILADQVIKEEDESSSA